MTGKRGVACPRRGFGGGGGGGGGLVNEVVA